MLQANRSKAGRRLAQSAETGCGEEFRNCADIAVLGSGVPAPTPTPAPSQPTAAPRPTPAPSPTPTQGTCVRNLDCSVNAWCLQENYDAWCASQGASGDCPWPQCRRESMPEPEPEAEPEPEHEPEAEPEPEPEHEPEAPSSTREPSSTAAPVTGTSPPEMACLPTNYAYRLYCADQSAAGLCPSPWCETGVAFLQAGSSRESRARHHSFLGTALIQNGANLERRVLGSMESQEEL